jgi:3-phenylpropionate/trans-cinnamate dioxygenase ferredoxin reductase subunit
LILGTAVQQLDVAAKRAILTDGRIIDFEKALIATVDIRSISQSQARTCPACITYEGLMTPWRLPRKQHRGCAPSEGRQRSNQAQVADIRGADRVSAVMLKSGDLLACDFVVIGVGILPNVELAKEAGLVVDNGIVVNEYLQSSHPNVYAAGDVANYMDPIFQKRRRVEHWGHAEYCGQLAGQNMAGAHTPYDLLTSVWSDLFDLHLEFAGDESEHDHVFVRGHVGDLSYFILYLKQHTLTAYFAVNASTKDFPLLQRAIKQHKNLSGKESQIQDPSIPLKSIV